jgi:hypothetical protein
METNAYRIRWTKILGIVISKIGKDITAAASRWIVGSVDGMPVVTTSGSCSEAGCSINGVKPLVSVGR